MHYVTKFEEQRNNFSVTWVSEIELMLSVHVGICQICY